MDLAVVRRGSVDSSTSLDKHTVGNALVVHSPEGMTAEAQALALGVAPDTEYDLVVVDLPANSPIAMWESVAKVLPRRRRGVRLVIGGRSRETSALAGQWLAERLNRPVVAPDGAVIPSAGGALFVHSGHGSGWVRFQPGQPPKWEAKRFPRPAWDSGVTSELAPTSSRGVAEPLPGGVWVRPIGFDQQQLTLRTTLTSGMPADHDTMAIVLGCPGCPPLTVDDAARLWTKLPEPVRANVRFTQFGPMSAPAGTTFGQALADLLGKEVAFYTGLPVIVSRGVDVRTVLFDGRLGWNMFAREVSYRPRTASGAIAPPAMLLAHRAPLRGLNEVAPAVYWYAPDAVIEVVQSGLLVRSPEGTANSPAVRAITPDDVIANLSFEAANERDMERMRMLAEDVRARLDHGTRRVSRVLPAAALAAERSRVQVTSKALATMDAGDHRPALADITPTEVVVVDDGERTIPPGVQEHYRPAAPAALGLTVTAEPQVLRVSPSIAQRLEPSSSVSAAVPATAALRMTPRLPPPTAGVSARDDDGFDGNAATVSLPRAVRDDAGWVEPPAGDGLVVPVSVSDHPVAADSGVIAGQHAKPVGLQPVPDAEAAALLTKRGVDKEREWLRKLLGAEYGLMSNALARVLSEHPGFQGDLSTSSEEVLTDAVAVQLYLSEKGALVDAGLRAAGNGPHVPVARCVVAGLRRLPSHRGPATFSAVVPSDVWALLRSRQVLTEWGFLNALTEPSPFLGGDTDVLLWSITGRRTKLLEPTAGSVGNRVLFVPGTSFKILEQREPTAGARGLVLLRELTESEIDSTGKVASDRVSLDELALVSLRRKLDLWADIEQPDSTSATKIDKRAAERFGTLPGLV